MATCKNCGTELVMVPGRRPKEFCNSTCRSNHFQKEHRKKIVPIVQTVRTESKIMEVDTKTGKILKETITDKPNTTPEQKEKTKLMYPKESDYLKKRREMKSSNKKS